MKNGYPYFLSIPTRWKDNDVFGHVNNVEYYSYVDTVITSFIVSCPINNVAFVAIKMGRRQGARRAHILIDT
jgi:acyl-CoA thioesterase FadM